MGKSNKNIKILENFLDKETCKTLSECLSLKTLDLQEPLIFIPKKRFEENKEIFDLLNKIESNIKTTIIENYKEYNIKIGLGNKKQISFACRTPGYSMEDHTDWDHQENTDDYIRSNITSLIYLNDGYEGGEIIFSDNDLSYKPTIGTLILFPSNYKHGVLASYGENRHNLTCFYCFI